MSLTISQIIAAFGGEIGIEYYADNYQGERRQDVYDTYQEAAAAFDEACKFYGLKKGDWLPLCNYVNPIFD